MAEHPPISSLERLRAEAEAARAAGDLPAAAFGYAAAIGMLGAGKADDLAYDLHLARAICLHGAGDYSAEADELACLDLITAQLGDPARRVVVALRRANLLILSGDTAAAQLVAATALAEARSAGDLSLTAESLYTLSEAAFRLGDFGTARARAEAALAAYQGSGNSRGEAYARRILGRTLIHRGQHDEGLAELYRSLDLCRASGERAGEALALNAIGISSSDHAVARAVCQQGLSIAESIGDREIEALLANNLGTIYINLGLYGQARVYAARAVRLARALGARDLLAAFLDTLGRAYGGMGQIEKARMTLREAYALAESTGNRETAAVALICLGRAALAEGRTQEAAETLDSAVALCTIVGAHAELAAAFAWRSAVYLADGEREQALDLSARAATLADALGHGGEFPVQEIWWQRYRVLAVTRSGEPGGSCISPHTAILAGTSTTPEADEALARARDAMYAGIATLSDPGLYRSYLGRVGINRAIIESLARSGDPIPPPMRTVPIGIEDRLTRMLGVSVRLNELRDAAALREMFLDEVVELSGAERLLLMIGTSPDSAEATIARGISPGELPALRAAATPLIYESLRRRRPLLREDPGDPGDAGPLPMRARSCLAVPLISGARTVGVLYGDVRAIFGPFGSDDLDLIGILAAQAATALENASLYAQILRAKEELEREVAARTADLLAANKSLEARAAEAQAAHAAAEAASAAKSAFLANVSHELRTPLNAVIGFAQVLQRDQEIGPRQRELVQIIARNGDHLLGLINDVLELARIEAGRLSLNPRPFDLYQLLNDLDGLFRLRVEARKVAFSIKVAPGVPRFVVGDEGRLRQVAINLLSNALKFTHAGAITLRADAAAASEHTRLRIAVSDTGEGIAPSEQGELFQPFGQTESGRRTPGGTGLGLALSRQIARLMGGDISVVSAPGVGSTFTVEVQLDRAVAPPETPQERQVVGIVAAGRRYRALVADNRWQNRKLLDEWLRQAGFEVRQTADGSQALAVWSEWRPHIALIDFQLPLVNGYEAARRIKESPAGRSTVVIAISSSNSEATVGAPWCDEVLIRPVRHDELLACIARHLGLDLRYAEPAPRPTTSPLTAADLGALPPGLRRQLAEAAAISDPALVEAAMARIRVDWPELGDRLAILANEFQFDLIELLAGATPTADVGPAEEHVC